MKWHLSNTRLFWQKNITKIYRKAERSTQLSIERDVKTNSKTLQLDKRIERYTERSAFISLKGHTENFEHNTKCLIKPSKGEMVIVSKTFLLKISNNLKNHMSYNQWRSTSTVLEWFRATEPLSKAFNKVWHEGLLLKPNQNGISGNLLKLLRHFLPCRKQRVDLTDQHSSWDNVNAEVPQGSILGCCYFLFT